MAKTKDTPKLPGSSRLQAPSTTDRTSGIIKEMSGMAKGKSESVSSRLVSSAKGKTGMKGMNPYGKSC
jgi:hypothetical protein